MTFDYFRYWYCTVHGTTGHVGDRCCQCYPEVVAMSFIPECPFHGGFYGSYCPQCASSYKPNEYYGTSSLGGSWTCAHCGCIKGLYTPCYNPLCVLNAKQTTQTTNTDVSMKKERKYLPTIAELIDRLTIVQQKELKIPEHREEYTKEIQDLLHDIEVCLDEVKSSAIVDAKQLSQMIRDIVVLTLMNCEIWHNESNFRKGIKDGNNLELTHGLNGIRNTAKNKIQEQFGGRCDFKIDNVEAFKNWVPSGYGNENIKDILCENCGLEVHPNVPCEEVGGADKRKAK